MLRPRRKQKAQPEPRSLSVLQMSNKHMHHCLKYLIPLNLGVSKKKKIFDFRENHLK